MRTGLVVALIAAGLGGCGSGTEPAGDDAADTGATTTSSGASGADDGVSDDATSSNPTTATATTGSDDGVCGIYDADAPSVTVEHGDGQLPQSDATLSLECGVQGSFMFFFPVEIYGIDTMGADSVDFDVTIDVDGFNDVGGDGHFISRTFGAYVGCEDTQVAPSSLAVTLPDEVPDPEVLDGAAFSLTIVMMPGSPDEQTVTSSGIVSASNDGGWDWCLGCGGEFGECPNDTTGGETGTGTDSDSGSGSDGSSSSSSG